MPEIRGTLPRLASRNEMVFGHGIPVDALRGVVIPNAQARRHIIQKLRDAGVTGVNGDIGESEFNEDRFLDVLEGLEGKFLLTCGVRGKLPGLLEAAGFSIERIRTPRSIGSMRGVGGPLALTRLVAGNHEPPSRAAAVSDRPYSGQPGQRQGSQPMAEGWLAKRGNGARARRASPKEVRRAPSSPVEL